MLSDITESTRVEDLVEEFPQAIGLFIEHGLPCVVCGEPFWGTIADLAGQKGWDAGRISRLIDQLNERIRFSR